MNTESLEKMGQLRLFGMQRSYRSLIENRGNQKLTPDELISLLIQAEWEDKENLKLSRRLTNAHFRYQASMEELDFTQNRNLDKNQLLRFSDSSFIGKAENVLITGPTGVGKSFVTSALGRQACLKGYKTIYFNTQKLFSALKIAKASGAYAKEITRIEKQDLLILDDFGLKPLDDQNSLALLEIIEDRHGKKSTIICSQLPCDKWYEIIQEGTIADAIMDRLLYNAHKIELKGESMRKKTNFVK